MALEDELSCPVCTEVFRDPVLLSCGHSFCRQCIYDHWSSSSSRNCPVCRQVSVPSQKPVSNLGLRNACETFLREQNKRTKTDGGLECFLHGEKLELFCQTDEEVICATCKKQEHRRHKTQPLQQAVQQRKGKQKAALRSAEKTLLSFHNGSARDPRISRYIQFQAQQTERRIRDEFEKLHQFLRQEEESRISALSEEENEKRGKMERRIQGEIRSLSDRVEELKEGIEDDDITFLQNHDKVMNRAQYTLTDADLSSESLIDVPKHLGNLKYQVWEKMKDVCPYYPLILNPNVAPPDASVSDDLTSVTSCHRWHNELNPLPLHRSPVVPGSVGYADADHTWEIQVGNSRHWSLGVCFGLEGKFITHPLTPENGFWGLERDGDSFKWTTAGMSRFSMKENPEVVRVTLDFTRENMFVQESREPKRWRRVSFTDARREIFIGGFNRVPLENKLFPFVISEDPAVPLRVVPANVFVTVERKQSFLERNRDLLIYCFVSVIAVFVILLGKSDTQGR